MKYLVTGGAGFIGSHLANKLLKQGHEVVVVDNLSGGKKERVPEGAKFVELDITAKEFQNTVQLEKPDGIFHLAAIPRVPVSMQDPVGTTHANTTGTVNVFKAAHEAKVPRVISASSSSVYGDQKKLPLQEDMKPNPLSPYALHKYTGEHFARIFTDNFDTNVVSLRYFNVYGPELDPESEYSLVLGKFLKLKSQNKPLTIFGDGEQTRGFSYIDDVNDANIKAMQSDKLKGGEVINIGAEKGNSVNELAELIGGEREYLPPRAGDVRHTAADTSRARELLNWQPKIGFKEGVQKTIKWFEENYK